MNYDQNNRPNDDQPPPPLEPNHEAIKAGGAAVAGAVAGAVTSASIGGMGLTVAGTAVSIGAAPVVAAGAIVGLAGYGIYKLFGGK